MKRKEPKLKKKNGEETTEQKKKKIRLQVALYRTPNLLKLSHEIGHHKWQKLYGIAMTTVLYYIFFLYILYCFR